MDVITPPEEMKNLNALRGIFASLDSMIDAGNNLIKAQEEKQRHEKEKQDLLLNKKGSLLEFLLEMSDIKIKGAQKRINMNNEAISEYIKIINSKIYLLQEKGIKSYDIDDESLKNYINNISQNFFNLFNKNNDNKDIFDFLSELGLKKDENVLDQNKITSVLNENIYDTLE